MEVEENLNLIYDSIVRQTESALFLSSSFFGIITTFKKLFSFGINFSHFTRQNERSVHGILIVKMDKIKIDKFSCAYSDVTMRNMETADY